MLNKEKNIEARKKYPVVNKLWIHYCYIFFCLLREEDFLTENFKQNVYYAQSYILEKNKDNIEQFYSLDDSKILKFVIDLKAKETKVKEIKANDMKANYI